MKIEHINHASVLIEGNSENFVLTDPWYISPAFGGWVQRPQPYLNSLRKILSIPQEKLTVVVSHGHDDHLDEFFISHHLKDCNFVVPKFENPGLVSRIERLINKKPLVLTEKVLDLGGWKFSSFINDEFTFYDAIVSISDGISLCIHANDNWHEYPKSLIEKLSKKIVGVGGADKSYFLVQFGVADSFPINYSVLSDEECLGILEERIDNYGNAFTKNIENLCLDSAFIYANQTTYSYPSFRSLEKTPYEMVQSFLEKSNLPIEQLLPGQVINCDKKKEVRQENEISLFSFCLNAFLTKARKFTKKDNLFFKVNKEDCESEGVCYYTDMVNWQRILIGELTLESITIGGLGSVTKPKDSNISDLHHSITKFSYMAQAQIKKLGLGYYDLTNE